MLALAATGFIWVRYSMVITPVNYSLAAVSNCLRERETLDHGWICLGQLLRWDLWPHATLPDMGVRPFPSSSFELLTYEISVTGGHSLRKEQLPLQRSQIRLDPFEAVSMVDFSYFNRIVLTLHHFHVQCDFITPFLFRACFVCSRGELRCGEARRLGTRGESHSELGAR